MESKLGLNFDLVNQARASAAYVADDTQRFINQHTTVTVERAVCRLLGIDGVNDMDVPLPNVVVDHMMATSFLPVGASWAIGNAMIETGMDPQAVAEAIDRGELDLSKVPAHSDEEIRAAITPVVNATIERINKNVRRRNEYLKEFGDKEGPYLYIIVATGNIYEDIIQAKAGAKQGADIIAVIRTTGQSLLDYVPYGATTEGFGGTYATQENFRLMRAALDSRGGHFVEVVESQSMNVSQGKCVLASPDGRFAYDPVNDNCSPVMGRDVSGPTACINSVAHLDQKNAKDGCLYNIRFDPRSIQGEKGLQVLGSIVKTYFANMGEHIQINVVDDATLRAAQKNPENYRNLLVRVAGYLAYFVELDSDVQEALIARTSHHPD